MKYVYYTIYTIGTLFCWSLLRAGLEPRQLGILLMMVYTFYSSYEIRRVVEQEGIKLKIIKLLGPLFMLCTFFFLNGIYWFDIINPIVVAFMLLTTLTFLDEKIFPSRTTQFFILSFSIAYSLNLSLEWERLFFRAYKLEKPNFELPKPPVNTNPAPIANLNRYDFLNEQLDTINLSSTGKYTLIETWNERCPPCVKAMKELKPFYNSLGSNIQQRYVYVQARKGYALDYPKIFSYKYIEHHDRILVDVNLQEEANLEGYPNFLLFDPAGELVLRQHGYYSAGREELENKIQAASAK